MAPRFRILFNWLSYGGKISGKMKLFPAKIENLRLIFSQFNSIESGTKQNSKAGSREKEKRHRLVLNPWPPVQKISHRPRRHPNGPTRRHGDDLIL